MKISGDSLSGFLVENGEVSGDVLSYSLNYNVDTRILASLLPLEEAALLFLRFLSSSLSLVISVLMSASSLPLILSLIFFSTIGE